MRQTPKARAYKQFSRIGRALSNPSRLELLDLLCQGEKTVETLCEQSGLGFKNTSAQLKELKEARLVDSRKNGKYVYYRLADPAVERFWLSTRALAEARLTEIRELTQAYFSDPSTLTPIDRKSLVSRAKRGDVILLDVRPREEFDAGHLPAAHSVPITELRKRMNELPKGKEVIAYCRGPYCVWADEAVELLRKKGIRASRLSDGVSEWRASGLPIELPVEASI